MPLIIVVVLVMAFAGSKKTTHPSRSKESQKTYTINTRKKDRGQSGDECWVKKNTSINIQGFNIENGMIYVGESLYTQDSLKYDYLNQIEPCLINPKLSVSKCPINIEQALLQYYPSYSQISPEARTNYLHWLEKGASDAKAYIGYVFLYFYGLERRFFIDKAKSEGSLLIGEIKRLKEIFSHPSFQHYANQFLSKAKVLEALDSGVCLYKESPIKYYESWETPLDIKMALAQMAKEGVSLNSDWALAWIYTDETTFFRTPAKRARNEFERLFTKKFQEKFPNGLMIKPNNKKMTANYRAASGSFEVELNLKDFPDIGAQETSKEQIRSIVEICTNLLDPYSRFLGRNPDKAGNLEAVILLPKEIQSDIEYPEINKIYDLLIKDVEAKGRIVLKGEEIFKVWPTKNASKMSKKEAENLSYFLQKHNVGIVPDMVYGDSAFRSSDSAILFKLSKSELKSGLSEGYRLASVFLELAMMVALADDHLSENETLHLAERLENLFKLSENEKIRLEIKMDYLVKNKSELQRINSKIAEQIPKEKRSEMATYLLALAGADGKIDSSEVKALTNIYKYLELTEDQLYSDLNSLGAHAISKNVDGPVTVRKGTKEISRYGIPKAPKKNESILILDMDVVRSKVKDTEHVSKLLQNVFAEEEHVKEEEQNIISNQIPLDSLDKLHRALLQELCTKERWVSEEFEKLAASFNLLPGGAIEVINNWAFDSFEEPILEEDNGLTVNLKLYEKVLSNE